MRVGRWGRVTKVKGRVRVKGVGRVRGVRDFVQPQKKEKNNESAECVH